MIDFTSLNFLAILVAIVVNQAIGAAWYSVLFGKRWMDENGLKVEDIDKKDATKSLILSIIFAVVGYFLLAVFIQMTGAQDWSSGAVIGLLLGLFAAVPMATNSSYEQRSSTLFFINAFYPIVAYTFGGAIIGAWM